MSTLFLPIAATATTHVTLVLAECEHCGIEVYAPSGEPACCRWCWARFEEIARCRAGVSLRERKRAQREARFLAQAERMRRG